MASGSKKIVLVALGANAAIATGKFAVGFLTGSAAMLAEAAHSVADTVNQGFLLVSINLSDNPADEEHPYGHGKERFFWAFLAAVFIFVAGAFFSVYQGVEKLLAGGEHHGSFWPSYLVLGLAFVFDMVVLILAVREARHQAAQAGIGVREFLKESTDVTLKTALYEDLAATTGVVLAALGLFLLQITGNPVFDGIASILIGIVLIAVAIMLGRETRDLLLGSAASKRTRLAIRGAIAEFPEVESVVALLTMQLGLDSVLVTGEINIADKLTTNEIEQLLYRVAIRIRQAAPEVMNIYLEPHPVPEGSGDTSRRKIAERDGGAPGSDIPRSV
ncbi:MAG: cation diffusion facilitator family transporter [Chloroflexota bacterium]|nr:cation diffusion facilitator family transporter [Chloroflexota bacterium]